MRGSGILAATQACGASRVSAFASGHVGAAMESRRPRANGSADVDDSGDVSRGCVAGAAEEDICGYAVAGSDRCNLTPNPFPRGKRNNIRGVFFDGSIFRHSLKALDRCWRANQNVRREVLRDQS